MKLSELPTPHEGVGPGICPDAPIFAEHLCDALGRPVHTFFAIEPSVADISESELDGVETKILVGQWNGTRGAKAPQDSTADFVSGAKVLELISMGGLDPNRDELLMTPTGFSRSLGFMGGVSGRGVAIGVSKWKQEHDQLLALILWYQAVVDWDMKLHHVGFRYPSEPLYLSEEENGLREGGIIVPADHRRIYIPTKSGHYEEHQFFPDGLHDQGAHWDLQVQEPEIFLRFIASAYIGVEPVFLKNPGENDPVGAVWIEAEGVSPLGVMARKAWWDIEK